MEVQGLCGYLQGKRQLAPGMEEDSLQLPLAVISGGDRYMHTLEKKRNKPVKAGGWVTWVLELENVSWLGENAILTLCQ